MANLIGYLTAYDKNRQKLTSRLASERIEAQLETWQGSIKVTLCKDGSYSVKTGGKGDPINTIANGQIHA